MFVCCTNWVDLGVPDERPHHNHGNLTLAILSVASFLLDRVNFSQDPNHPYLARLCQYLDKVVLPKEDKVLLVVEQLLGKPESCLWWTLASCTTNCACSRELIFKRELSSLESQIFTLPWVRCGN